jgi:hypothetical protein
VNFRDNQLRECYERNLSEMAGYSEPVRQVTALIAAYDFFRMLEGPHSARVHETIDCLLCPELRPGLRDWYRQSKADSQAVSTALREQLNSLTGEKLESEEDLPANPS